MNHWWICFEPTLKTWFLKGKNLSHSSTNDGGEDDSDEEEACNNFILKRRAMLAALGQHVTQMQAPPAGGGTRVQEGGKLWALHIHTQVALKSLKKTHIRNMLHAFGWHNLDA